MNHPDRLRSLVLDATYPLPGTDPAYGDLAEATWRAPRSCARGGRAARTAARSRAPRCSGSPSGSARGPCAGSARTRRASASGCASTSTRCSRSPSPATPTCRLPRPARRDPRLRGRRPRADAAPRGRDDAGARGSPVRSFSEGLYLAITCHDYPQMWDPAAPLAVRRQQLRASRPRSRPTATRRSAAPSGPPAVRGRHRVPALAGAAAPRAAGRRPTRRTRTSRRWCSTATSTTSPRPAGAQVVAQRFPRSTFVETQNSVHVSALGDRDGCAAPLVRRFVRPLERGRHELREPRGGGPGGRDVPAPCGGGRRRGPAAGRPQHGPGAPRRRGGGGHGGRRDPALDAQLRRHDRGLRGGRWSWSGDRFVRFRFRKARFARDVPVSGRATWSLDSGAVRADLRLPGRGRVRARWSMHRQLAVATLSGRLDGRRLRATMLAP